SARIPPRSVHPSGCRQGRGNNIRVRVGLSLGASHGPYTLLFRKSRITSTRTAKILRSDDDQRQTMPVTFAPAVIRSSPFDFNSTARVFQSSDPLMPRGTGTGWELPSMRSAPSDL